MLGKGQSQAALHGCWKRTKLKINFDRKFTHTHTKEAELVLSRAGVIFNLIKTTENGEKSPITLS